MKRIFSALVLGSSMLTAGLVSAQVAPTPPASAQQAAQEANVARFYRIYGTAPSAASAAAVRQTAATAANLGSRSSPTVDSQGNLVAGGASQPVVSRNPSAISSVQDLGRYTAGVLGTSAATVDTLANPARGQGAGASLSISGEVDFNCAARPGAFRNSKGAQFKLVGCSGQPPATTITVDLCTASLLRPDTCLDSDFVRYSLPEGLTIQAQDGVKISSRCNSSQICRVSFSTEHTIRGTAQQIQQQGAAAAASAANSQGSLAGAVSSAYGSTGYAQSYSNLSSNNVISALQGSTTTSGQTCTQRGRCLNEVTSERTFARTCDRTLPLTERLQQVQLPASAVYSCEVLESPLSTPSNRLYNPLSCDQNITRNMVVVGERFNFDCASLVTHDDFVCDGINKTYYWANVDAFAAVTTTYSPLPLSQTNPVCDERPQAQVSVCGADGNWFGRTLSAAQCTVSESLNGVLSSRQLDYRERMGCGVCMDKQVSSTCYGQPTSDQPADSCAGVDLNGCSLTSAVPLTLTDDGAGLVTAQRETYTCTRTSSVCTQYEEIQSTDGACAVLNSDIRPSTFGLENQPSAPADTAAFAQVAATASVADQIARGLQDAGASDPNNLPRIFSGEAKFCSYPTSGFLGAGNLLTRNCCRNDLERPRRGVLTQNGCEEDEVELAIAKRAGYAHYIGERCTNRTIWGSCLTKKQTYCTFNGMLPRLVAEQGRQQLAQLAATSSSASLQRKPLNFNFYAPSDTGNWTAPEDINGVKVAAFQWPRFCADVEEMARRQVNDPNSVLLCPPRLSVSMAVCENSTGCGDLPSNPAFGGNGWGLSTLDPLAESTVALSSYAVAKGACNTASSSCSYEVSAWPVGQGGKQVVTRDISFAIWDSSAAEGTTGNMGTSTSATGVFGSTKTVGEFYYKTFSLSGRPTSLPSTMPFGFAVQVAGAPVWTTVQVPTGQAETPLGTTGYTLSGSCDYLSNSCTYRLVGTVTVTALDWGDVYNPVCDGFTPGQLAVLDFSKMDLSAWLDTVMQTTSTNMGNLQDRVSSSIQGQAANANRNGGGAVTAPTATGVPYAVATPDVGIGPFEVTVAAGGYYPGSPEQGYPNGKRVTAVSIQWGDCTSEEAMPVVTSIGGKSAHGFRATRRFKAPNDAAYTSCGIAADATVRHEIKLRILTNDGATREMSLFIRNGFNSY